MESSCNPSKENEKERGMMNLLDARTLMRPSSLDSFPKRRWFTGRGLTERRSNLPSLAHCEKGSVLVVALVVSILLALIGMYSASLSSMGVRIAANYKQSAQAAYATHAGLEEARLRLPAFSQGGMPTASWRAFLGTEAAAAGLLGYNSSDSKHTLVAGTQSVMDYAVEIRHKTEADCGIDLNGDGDRTDIVLWGDPNGDTVFEQNTITGKPIEMLTCVSKLAEALEKLRMEIYRDTLDLKYAVFGDKSVDTKQNGAVWKGISDAPFPAAIGSNEFIEVRNNVSIYGDVDVGKDDGGIQGSYADHGGTIWGAGPDYVDRIDPDPLGLFVADSDLDKEVTSAMTSNSNATGATPTITGNILSLGNAGSMTLRGGSYYLTSIRLEANAILTIDVSFGPVNIYLDGPLETESSGAIRLIPAGSPPGLFTLYCKAVDGSSFSSIDIKNGAAFHGVIYAPKANVNLRNGGDVQGMIWGRVVDIKNSGDIIFDPRLKRKFLSPRYSMRSWKEE
jgi:hypothetical protein